MVALPPLKSRNQVLSPMRARLFLDLAKEEQTKRQLCEGGEVGTKGPISTSNAAFKRGQRICTCIYPMPSVAGSLSRHADNLFGGFNKKA